MEMIGKKENGRYFADMTEQGMIFKDYVAFYHYKDDICYIAECGFENDENENENGIVDDWSISEETAKEGIGEGAVYTYNSMFEEVKDYLEYVYGNYKIDNGFVDEICGYLFRNCDWQCIGTLMNEADFDDDLLWYVVKKAKTREDWNDEWDEDCLYDFLKENIDSPKNWDDIIDEFVNLPNL